jgi:hypothetical protein
MRKVELRTHFSAESGEKVREGPEEWNGCLVMVLKNAGCSDRGIDVIIFEEWIVFSFSRSAGAFAKPPTTVDKLQSGRTPTTVASPWERGPLIGVPFLSPEAAQQSIG